MMSRAPAPSSMKYTLPLPRKKARAVTSCQTQEEVGKRDAVYRQEEAL
jgi:hypothetical protein